jgi:oxepin-CoA hydrolase/3-oxo-5,6-dehydrosuberyl-CoA semialdehyde dehydrogenase
VATLVTADRSVAAKAIPAAAAWHGRLLVLDSEAAKESTGHGSPLPQLKHGGPGRAGGGEELGGLRAVKHYLQRAAVQGSPSMLMAVTGEYVRGAEVIETEVHPFRRYFDDLRIGESLLTHRRTVTEADLVNFGCLSGDHFYMHFDEIAAKRRSSASASPTATSCCRRRPGCSFRRVKGRCWPTMAWIPCASSPRWALATPSRRG